MNPNPGPSGPQIEERAQARALAEIDAWTNSAGLTFDPCVRDCLACGGYRDPYAEACACGRALAPILWRVEPSAGERQAGLIKAVLWIALAGALLALRIASYL